ncbi:MAG: hypothetical protein AAFP90_05030, partial [Planctomycetota bacterium]
MASRSRLISSKDITSSAPQQGDSDRSGDAVQPAESRRDSRRRNRRRKDLQRRRGALVETLESRQLLAGPQLIGIQPNGGDLIDFDGSSVRNVAPRLLTFRFDQDQSIDPLTVGEAIQITRDGNDDGVYDVPVTSGQVSVDPTDRNEVLVRFAETLPDDIYRITVNGFDDASRGIIGLRNTEDELLVPRTLGARSEVVDFELKLGGLVEAVVPQPVVRQPDNSLVQLRNQIHVYFNEDPLFVENVDDTPGAAPTERSAENPRFYQLL